MHVRSEACVATTRLCPPVTLLHNKEMCSILPIEKEIREPIIMLLQNQLLQHVSKNTVVIASLLTFTGKWKLFFLNCHSINKNEFHVYQ